jgi:hypothetical protein
VSAATIYTWKSRFGGLQVSDAHKLKGLELAGLRKAWHSPAGSSR